MPISLMVEAIHYNLFTITSTGRTMKESPRFSGVSSCFLMEVGSGVEPLYVDLQSTT